MKPLARLIIIVFLAAIGFVALVMFLTVRAAHAESIMATWYCPGFEGRRTASGETFHCNDLTAAHRTLRFGTHVRVTYRCRSVVVRINDRGPYTLGDIDLSSRAAQAIGMRVTSRVNIEVMK